MFTSASGFTSNNPGLTTKAQQALRHSLAGAGHRHLAYSSRKSVPFSIDQQSTSPVAARHIMARRVWA